MDDERFNKLLLLREILNGGTERWNEIKALELYFLGMQSASCACKYNVVLASINAEYQRTLKQELENEESNRNA